MYKTILVLLIGCMGICTSQASTLSIPDGKTTPTQKGDTGYSSLGRPRAPRHASAFQIWYEPGLNAVLVISSTDVGLVQAVIENLSTGASYICSFDSSAPAILPISGEPGVWRVVLRYSLDNVFTYTFNE